MEVPVQIPVEKTEDLRVLLSEVNEIYQSRLDVVIGIAQRTSNRREKLQCAEEAVRALLETQIQTVGSDRTGFLMDPAIQQLKDCIEVPPSLKMVLDDPDMLWDALPLEDDLPGPEQVRTEFRETYGVPSLSAIIQKVTEKICELLPDAICDD